MNQSESTADRSNRFEIITIEDGGFFFSFFENEAYSKRNDSRGAKSEAKNHASKHGGGRGRRRNKKKARLNLREIGWLREMAGALHLFYFS